MVYLDKPTIGSPKHAFREADRLRARGKRCSISVSPEGVWTVELIA